MQGVDLMAKKFKIEGMKELKRSIKRLGDVPQRAVTPSARKGMNIAFKTAQKLAPEDKGYLKMGLTLKGERSRHKGKKVYQVTFKGGPAWNDIFQTRNSLGEITGYYPASQNYGFFARNGRYIPGYHFLEKALENNAKTIEKTIVQEMLKRIDKELRR